MAVYAPGTQEKDHQKQNMALQLHAGLIDTANTNIATNTADIANRVVGPSSSTNNGFAVYNGTTGKLIKDHPATIALASEVSGTLPVANGGTGDTGTAWTVTTPTVTASSGTFTTVSCSFRYKIIGKTALFSATVTITNAGTATGNILFDMPFTPSAVHAGGGKETVAVGFQCNWQITTGAQVAIAKYDNTSIIASGRTVVIGGVIETT
jgi:hypothetical protein